MTFLPVLIAIVLGVDAKSPALGSSALSPVSAAIPVTIVLTERFTGDTSLTAVMRRDPGRATRELVVIERSALTPELVFAALKALSGSITRHGDQPKSRITVLFTSKRAVPKLSAAQTAYAQNIIDRLLTSAEQVVPEMSGRHQVLATSIGQLP